MQTVTSALRRIDPRSRIAAAPLVDLVEATMSRERFIARIAAVRSALALFLSCAGLYAAVAHGVTERRAEMAVRLALGATARHIVLLVVTGPVRTTLVGIAAGLPLAYMATRSLAGLLFGVSALEPAIVAGCSLTLVGLASAAAFWPARRAASVDPQECFRWRESRPTDPRLTRSSAPPIAPGLQVCVRGAGQL